MLVPSQTDLLDVGTDNTFIHFLAEPPVAFIATCPGQRVQVKRIIAIQPRHVITFRTSAPYLVHNKEPMSVNALGNLDCSSHEIFLILANYSIQPWGIAVKCKVRQARQ